MQLVDKTPFQKCLRHFNFTRPSSHPPVTPQEGVTEPIAYAKVTKTSTSGQLLTLASILAAPATTQAHSRHVTTFDARPAQLQAPASLPLCSVPYRSSLLPPIPAPLTTLHVLASMEQFTVVANICRFFLLRKIWKL